MLTIYIHAHTPPVQLQPGVLDLLHYIAERGVKRALMTRNSTKAAKSFLQRLNDLLAGSKDKYPHLQQNQIFSEVCETRVGLDCTGYHSCLQEPSIYII